MTIFPQRALSGPLGKFCHFEDISSSIPSFIHEGLNRFWDRSQNINLMCTKQTGQQSERKAHDMSQGFDTLWEIFVILRTSHVISMSVPFLHKFKIDVQKHMLFSLIGGYG